MKEKLSPSLEDYLETIYLIKKEKTVVKPIEVAKRLVVKKPCVTDAVKKLSKKGLVKYKKYGDITLTKRGMETSEEIYDKHKILVEFLVKVLKIKKEIAKKDACKIEHILSPTTLNKLTKFLEQY
jgi:DtxR family Mn-dependent transcriptional regulator